MSCVSLLQVHRPPCCLLKSLPLPDELTPQLCFQVPLSLGEPCLFQSDLNHSSPCILPPTVLQYTLDFPTPGPFSKLFLLPGMSSFTHLYPSFKTHPKCHLLQEIPPPQSTPKQTWSLLQLVLGIDHIPSCFHFLETIRECQRQCAPAHMSQFCASLPKSRLSEIILVV